MKFKIFIACLLSLASAASADELIFIVNVQNENTEITKADIRDYFYKRKRTWPDGTSVRFIDRSDQVPIRKVFLKDILGRTTEDLELFWIGQKLYSGSSAPLKEAEDSTTVLFVSSFKGAIGYVSSTYRLNSKLVKPIKAD
jgi:ABC-type phosphate transport system substrate-binding protein